MLVNAFLKHKDIKIEVTDTGLEIIEMHNSINLVLTDEQLERTAFAIQSYLQDKEITNVKS